MIDLTKSPFYLRSGADIWIRGSGCNVNGCGIPNANSIGQRIKVTGTPSLMSAPRKLSQTGSSVKLGWSPLPGFEFELQSREGASNFEPTTCRNASGSIRTECWKTVTKTMSTTFPVKGL